MSFLSGLASLLAVLPFVGLVAQPLWMMAMFGALSSIEIRRTQGRVELTSLDGFTCGVALLITAAGSALLWVVGRALDASVLCMLIACAMLFASALGCRVRLSVEAGSAECVRKVLWVVPWRRARLGSVVAWVDGWGDFSDPEALHVGEAGYEEESYRLELAWGSAGSGDRAERLAEELNRAVRELRGGRARSP